MTSQNGHQGFTRIPNPFIIGNPVDDATRFFGREDAFTEARQRLEVEKEGVVLLFVGERRSGKTSVLFQIRNGRLGPDFLPVFVDMQAIAGVMGDREFFAYMAERTCEYARDERIVPDYYDFSQGNPALAFDRLLEDLWQVFPDRRLIFLLDEAEILLNKVVKGELSGAILMYMASILERRRVSFFFTGSMGLGEKENEAWRQLIGKAWHRKISFLDRADAVRLMTQPVEGTVFYGEGVVEAIYRLTFGHPYYTQYICTSVVDYLNSGQRNRLERPDLEAVVETILDSPPQSIIYTWDDLTRPEQWTLSLLSEQSEDGSGFVHASTLWEAIAANRYPLPDLSGDAVHMQMEHLYQQRDMLDRDAEGGYRFRMDLFRRWVRRSRSIWRLMEEVQPKRSRTPVLVAMVGAVVALVVAAVFWLRGPSQEPMPPAAPTTGHLLVRSTPPGAEVFLDGQKQVDKTPVLLPELAGGRHAVALRREGYRSWRDSVEVVAGERKEYPLVLERLTGLLSVTSSPPGAQVRVHGEGVDTTGVTPLRVLVLPTGDYEIEVSKGGYLTHPQSVRIAQDTSTPVGVDLIARIGGLYIVSHPPGARVFLDGESQGLVTPARLDGVPSREYVLRLELGEHEPRDTTVSVQVGRMDTVSLRLRVLPATVELSSTPPEAAIYIDGADTVSGFTPWPLRLSPGRHRIRLVAEGHEPLAFEKELGPGRNPPEHRVLVPQYGWVRIVYFGTVVVDDAEEKQAPGTFRLSVGHHTVQIKGQSEGKEVSISRDETTVVRLP